VVESGALVGDNVQIGAVSYVVQGTIVRSGSRLWPNVTLYHGVELGHNCTVHSQSVIGADGFGYAPQKIEGNQHWLKIPQLGGVVVGDNTEIGASTTIDRGAIEDTKIGKGVIIDNQIQIGHNVEIGDYTAIAAATNIAGSTKIGSNVTIGGCCAIAGHLTICDNAFITGRTFVMKDISEPNVYSSGMPAATNKEWRNNTARYRKLTELFDRVKMLEKQLDKS
jgi:UDP-3-O-[3-hydroxymyristoyl] glucosamine N-acyltransferase